MAVALAQAEGIPLVRIQCYEGISPETILYDYDYQRQLLVVSAIRDKLNEAMKDMSVDESIRYVAGNVAFYGKKLSSGATCIKGAYYAGTEGAAH